MYSLLGPTPKHGGQSAPRPGHYIPRIETRSPSYRKLGGALGPVSCVLKIVPPPSFEPGTVQSVASQYIDYTITAPAKIRRPMFSPSPVGTPVFFFLHICLFSRAVYSSTLKMGAVRSSETSPYLYQVTRCYISLDSSNHNHRYKNRMSQLVCRDCQGATLTVY